MELRQPRLPCSRQRVLERELRLGGEADDYVRGQVEVVERLELAKVGRDVVAASHRLQNAVVARLQRDVQMLRDSRRLAQRLDQLRRDVVDLDRGEAQPLESRRGGDIANRARKQPRLTPVRTTSRCPCATRRRTSPITACALRLRVPPRTSGMTQKLQENEQPSWILTKARTRSRRASAWTQPIAPTSPATNCAASSLLRGTMTTFSGRSPNGSPSRFAPQPVT